MREEKDRVPYVEFGGDSFWPYQPNDTFPHSGDYRSWEEFEKFMLEHGVKVERVEPPIAWPASGVYWSEKQLDVYVVNNEFIEGHNTIYHKDDIEEDWREDLLPLVLMTKTGVTIG